MISEFDEKDTIVSDAEEEDVLNHPWLNNQCKDEASLSLGSHTMSFDPAGKLFSFSQCEEKSVQVC